MACAAPCFEVTLTRLDGVCFIKNDTCCFVVINSRIPLKRIQARRCVLKDRSSTCSRTPGLFHGMNPHHAIYLVKRQLTAHLLLQPAVALTCAAADRCSTTRQAVQGVSKAQVR
eukprot:364496-Chlamydomonas_euryale.AAC.30